MIFLKTDRDSGVIVWYCTYRYIILAITSEYPSQYIHHTKEAGAPGRSTVQYQTIASEILSVFRKITIRPPEEVLNLWRLVSSLPGTVGYSVLRSVMDKLRKCGDHRRLHN